MNWCEGLFKVWLIASIAWSGFYLAIALFNYATGSPRKLLVDRRYTPSRQSCWAW